MTLKVYSKATFLFYLISSNRFKHMKMMLIPHATVVWLHNWCSQVVMMDSARYCSHTPSFYGNASLKVWDLRCNLCSRPVGVFAGHKDGISHVESKVKVVSLSDVLLSGGFISCV